MNNCRECIERERVACPTPALRAIMEGHDWDCAFFFKYEEGGSVKELLKKWRYDGMSKAAFASKMRRIRQGIVTRREQ